MTELKAGILGLGGYLPDRVMSNAEWSRYVDTSDEWITERTGIRRRRIADERESTVDLAVMAARGALEQSGCSARDLDEIIVATDTPEVYIPDTAAFVQHRLGAGEISSYDLAGSGCAGFLQALDVAVSRIRTTRSKVLVIGVEVLSRLMNWRDRNTCVLFGDGAAAAVVGECTGPGEILAVVSGTDGSRTDILGLEVGGTRRPFTLERARQELHLDVVMKGREVFKEAVSRMSQAARAVLERARLSLTDVSLLIPHQANLRIIQSMAKSLGLPMEKVYVNVHEYGNTGSASVPIALWEARETARIREGDLVLLTAFGAGFHWAAAVIQY